MAVMDDEAIDEFYLNATDKIAKLPTNPNLVSIL
jgi:hypothetical protein